MSRLACFNTWLVLVLSASMISAAERRWQTGTWVDIGLKRQPFGVGPAGAAGPGTMPGTVIRVAPQVRTFVIETGDERFELQDVVPADQRSIEIEIGSPVTFAVEKNNVYVRDSQGREYRLRLTKKTAKPKT